MWVRVGVRVRCSQQGPALPGSLQGCGTYLRESRGHPRGLFLKGGLSVSVSYVPPERPSSGQGTLPPLTPASCRPPTAWG